MAPADGPGGPIAAGQTAAPAARARRGTAGGVSSGSHAVRRRDRPAGGWREDRRAVDAVLAASDAAGPDDSLAALALVAGLRSDVDDVERELIGLARRRGASWREVAAALGLGSRQAAEQRWLRLRAAVDAELAVERGTRRQRGVDTDSWPEVAALRAAVTTLQERLARLTDRDDPPAVPVTLAFRTLSAASGATPGALYDLARHAVADLRPVPPHTLGGPVVDALARVSAMVGDRPGTGT